jgi:hypothetical protein
MFLVVAGLWFGGRQLAFRNLSRIANISSWDTVRPVRMAGVAMMVYSRLEA